MTRVTTWSVRKITSHPFYETVIGSMWDDDEFEDGNEDYKLSRDCVQLRQMAAGVDRVKEHRAPYRKNGSSGQEVQGGN